MVFIIVLNKEMFEASGRPWLRLYTDSAGTSRKKGGVYFYALFGVLCLAHFSDANKRLCLQGASSASDRLMPFIGVRIL
jgi:hypothetical protein